MYIEHVHLKLLYLRESYEMKEIMESWRKKVLEPEEEEQTLVVDVEAVPGEFEEDDEVEIEVVDDDELDEWKKEDDDSYPSRKKRKHNRRMMKPDRASWHPGYSELAALGKGHVGLGDVALQEAKKPRKPWCHPHNPFHDESGQFTNPERHKGSASQEGPSGDSPADCRHGQTRRSSANRSTQATKRPCGRKGRYVCKDGSKKYQEALVLFEDYLTSDVQAEGKGEQFEAYLAGVIDQSLQRAVQKHMQTQGCSFAQLVRAMQLWSSAEKADLYKQKKSQEK
jgi:hypothetical protein